MSFISRVGLAPSPVKQVEIPVPSSTATGDGSAPNTSVDPLQEIPNFTSAHRRYAVRAAALSVYAAAVALVSWRASVVFTMPQALTYSITAAALMAIAGVVVWKFAVRNVPALRRYLSETVLFIGSHSDMAALGQGLPARLPFRVSGIYHTDEPTTQYGKQPFHNYGTMPKDYLLAPDAIDRVLLVSRSLDTKQQQSMLDKLQAFSCPITVCALPVGKVSLETTTFATLRPATDTPAGRFWKRAFDITATTLALIPLAPVLLVTAALVRFTSQGPVFFRQPRWGQDGRIFSIYKFRSMYVDQCDNGHGNVVQARKNDDRITKVGRVIRSTSIDELPQLLNVLKGDMSLIGPRPHAVGHNLLYTPIVDGYLARHRLKPGLSGWAQVHGHRGETPTTEAMQARIDCDNDYIRRWSLWMDIRIVFQTVMLVLSRKNAH